MSSPLVWFHHNGKKPNETKKFLESLLSFQASEGPGGLTMLAAGAGPFAALAGKEDRYGDRDEWIWTRCRWATAFPRTESLRSNAACCAP